MDDVVEVAQVRSSVAASAARIRAVLAVQCVCGAPGGVYCSPSVRGFHWARWSAGVVRGGVR